MTRSSILTITTTAILVTLHSTRDVFAFAPPVLTVTRTHRSSQMTSQVTFVRSHPLISLEARKRNENDDDDFDFFDDEEEDDGFYEPRRPRRRQRNSDDLGEAQDGRQDGGFGVPSSFGRRAGWRLPDSVSKALLAGIFILGIGLGVTIDSAINTNPRDLASRDAVDQAAPNSELCAKYGASAMAFDQRVFVSFNPFNVYVAQADVKPACVLRPSNVVPILQSKKLINDDEVRACKQNMNTWAFVGDLDRPYPQLSCVYKSNDAQNEFLSNPKLGIGEDVWDDDRASGALNSQKTGNTKVVKEGMTEAQKQLIREQLRVDVPGL